MTVCETCNEAMPGAVTCAERQLEGSGKSWTGVRYGDERRFSTEPYDMWADGDS